MTTDEILFEIRRELAALLGDDVSPDAVRADVDLFGSGEPLVGTRSLDSVDQIEAAAALEDRFGVDLATVVNGDEPLTLAGLARHIAGAVA